MSISWSDWLRLRPRPHYDLRLGVWFSVKRIPDSRVLWLNEKWFAEEGLDILKPEIGAEVEEWLLSRFGVIASDAHDSDSQLFADRYGETGGSIHGGAGRAGSRDGFYAKGVGRTPLVSDKSDFHHSHGGFWLYEAAREVIASEIVRAELQPGSVPIIALIDTHQDFVAEDADEVARRVIAVRPDFIRPALFERATFFGTAGFAGATQVLDAERVCVSVQAAERGLPPFKTNLCLRNMFKGIAVQIGAARSLNLWQGQFTCSNVTIDGSWADLGSFCAVPDWRRAERPWGPRFGTEDDLLKGTIASILTSFHKYGTRDYSQLSRSIASEVANWLESGFRQTLQKELRLDHLLTASGSSVFLDFLVDRFRVSQRTTVPFDLAWSRVSQPGETSAEILQKELTRLGTRSTPGGDPKKRAAILSRIFTPRHALVPDAADKAFKRRFNPSKSQFIHNRQSFSYYIQQQFNSARRIWPHIDHRFAVLNHFVSGSGSFLLAIDLEQGDREYYLVSGVRRGDYLSLGPFIIPYEQVADYECAKATGLIRSFRFLKSDFQTKFPDFNIPL